MNAFIFKERFKWSRLWYFKTSSGVPHSGNSLGPNFLKIQKNINGLLSGEENSIKIVLKKFILENPMKN